MSNALALRKFFQAFKKLPVAGTLAILIAVQLLSIFSSSSPALAAAPQRPAAAPSYRAYAELGIVAFQGWYNTSTGQWDNMGFWNSANGLQAIIDYSRRTGSTAYLSVISNTYDKIPASSYLTPSNDDNEWWALTWLSAYDLTGDVRYLNTAKTVFNDMTTQWNSVCGGGVYWNKTPQYKNAITNELFLVLAARLHLRTPGDTTYLNWAKQEWNWFNASGMINSQNLINDGINDTTTCLNNGQPVWTYNQGVILAGLADLYKSTGDASLITKAQTIADAAITHLIDANGVLKETACEPSCGPDGPQFKGIFMRNLAYLHETQNKATYQAFIIKNADSIWAKDRNSLNQFGLIWSGPFDAATPKNQSPAIDALVAAIPYGGPNLALNAAATANGSCAANEAASYAVDGNPATKWCSGATNNQYWLQVDLGASRSITQFVLRHAGSGGEVVGYNTRDFTIQLSTDNVNWSTVVTVAGNTASVTSHSITAATGRYARVLITNPQTSTSSIAARIYEFEVYGPAQPAIPTATRTATPLGPTATRTRTPTPGGPTPTRTRTPTPSAAGVIFYQDANYGGAASAVLAKGDYPSNPPSVINDWMSSLRVPAGWIVDAYADGNFGGAVCTYTADTSWVGTACNDVMSSFKIH